MKLLCRAKINWALAAVGKLPGGYHELDMLMESVTLADELTLTPADGLSLTVDGVQAGEENLVYRAAEGLRRHAGVSFGARMELVKYIPARAGLGGGSADCAAALAGLNRLWDLNLSHETLCEVGLALGADVPFCLTGGLCRAQGRGERLTRLSPGKTAGLVLVMYGPGLSTGEVFRALDQRPYPFTGDMEAAQTAVIARDMASVEKYARNSLYAPALTLDDAPGRLLADLYACGALTARMSGSGSACFGAFEDPEAAFDALKNRYDFCAWCETAPSGWEIIE